MYESSGELKFSNPVEMFEQKVILVKARNIRDVKQALSVVMESQDEIISINPQRGIIYECLIKKFIMRDGPTK
ncbi:hypothetical protein LCGC14_2437130 [marine sediment metagenome]|uniref:Uncharacterized protein n=1 Tax=marine sediment metagenome TaxID=412755 RepID=A0A0F9BK52_9ZZZZ